MYWSLLPQLPISSEKINYSEIHLVRISWLYIQIKKNHYFCPLFFVVLLLLTQTHFVPFLLVSTDFWQIHFFFFCVCEKFSMIIIDDSRSSNVTPIIMWEDRERLKCSEYGEIYWGHIQLPCDARQVDNTDTLRNILMGII